MKLEVEDAGGYRILLAHRDVLLTHLESIKKSVGLLRESNLAPNADVLEKLSRAMGQQMTAAEKIAQQMRQYEQLEKKRMAELSEKDFREELVLMFESWPPRDRQAFLDRLSVAHAKLPSSNQSAKSSARSVATE